MKKNENCYSLAHQIGDKTAEQYKQYKRTGSVQKNIFWVWRVFSITIILLTQHNPIKNRKMLIKWLTHFGDAERILYRKCIFVFILVPRPWQVSLRKPHFGMSGGGPDRPPGQWIFFPWTGEYCLRQMYKLVFLNYI